MIIHSDVLTEDNFRDAAKAADVTFDRFNVRGSRSRARAFDVTLNGHSNRPPNSGKSGGSNGLKAALWDQWGIFLSFLYEIDDNLKNPYYFGEWDFHFKTCGRFDPLDCVTLDEMCNHKWVFSGTPYHNSCNKCDAEKRWQ